MIFSVKAADERVLFPHNLLCTLVVQPSISLSSSQLAPSLAHVQACPIGERLLVRVRLAFDQPHASDELVGLSNIQQSTAGLIADETSDECLSFLDATIRQVSV